MAEHLRTMLVIGSTFSDALAFLGYDFNEGVDAARALTSGMPQALRELPRRDERPSMVVPDELWPPGEPFATWFRGDDDGITNENGSAPYDAVIVTAGLGAAEALAWGDIDKMLKPGGWCWVEKHQGRGPFWHFAPSPAANAP